ncbi:MAG: U32 family peptidase [Candidatus Omnitrophota bacterium]
MKIKSPLTDKKEVKPLAEAGADEFFCGIEPLRWRKRFRDFSISQRSTGANFTKLSDLEKAVSTAHKLKTKVHVAINAFFYLEEQYECALRIIEDVLALGADGIIFADFGLLGNTPRPLLKGKDTVIGTDAVIFNHEASNFYKRLGATRLVIPRAVTIKEIEGIVRKDASMEYEVFIIHDLCFFVDGFCTYCKEASGKTRKEGRGRKSVYFFSTSRQPRRGFGGGCRTRFKRRRISSVNNRAIGKARDFTFWMKKHIQGCGACAIYDLKEMGVASLKVLDRNLPTKGKVRATEFIRKSLDFLEDRNISKKKYVEKCKGLFKKTFGKKCNPYDCYYPSVFPR